ncbi:MAG: hypothetical protein IT423_20810 [Pirellulaceae bacterium]|nr:hypothetical protein [Pirellulaceae bacterium]
MSIDGRARSGAAECLFTANVFRASLYRARLFTVNLFKGNLFKGSLFKASLIVVLSGCGGSNEYETTPVRGVVTCHGKPVANATVNFTPLPEEGRPKGQRGRVALGLTDNEGRFTLTTYQDGDGAIVGKHTVTVGLNMDESSGKVQAFACKDSKKEVTVDRQTNEYKIEF